MPFSPGRTAHRHFPVLFYQGFSGNTLQAGEEVRSGENLSSTTRFQRSLGHGKIMLIERLTDERINYRLPAFPRRDPCFRTRVWKPSQPRRGRPFTKPEYRLVKRQDRISLSVRYDMSPGATTPKAEISCISGWITVVDNDKQIQI